MIKTTHTHRGTCQACGRVQAVDNAHSLVAKHGYTVNWGYFNGTCQGSDLRPAEHDVSHTHVVIAFCTKTADQHDTRIADLKSGKTVPRTFERYNREKVVTHKSHGGRTYTTVGGNDELPIEQATADERAKAIALAIHHNELHASGLRDHATVLTQRVLPRLGQPLYAVEDLNKKVEKPTAPTVDVETAKVEGTFATKAARQEALDKLNRQYEQLQNAIQAVYLRLPHEQRTKAKMAVYYGPYQLNHWRPKHSAAAVREFPEVASIVEQIDKLVAARAAVKAAP